MDFSKTKLYQRTRSGYEKLYLEYNKKKPNKRRRNSGTGTASGGGGLVSESEGDCGAAGVRVKGDDVKEKSGRKASEAVARRTRQAVRGKKKLGKNVKKVCLVDESEDEDDDGGGIEDGSRSEKNEKVGVRGQSRVKGKGKGKSACQDSAESKSKKMCGNSLSSGGFAVGGSEDEDGVMFLGDDAACLDDLDPSHSSRVESNEVKVSAVELDSVQADGEAKLSAEDDLQKPVSPEADGSACRDAEPAGDNGDKEVISLSSSSESEDGVDDEDDDCSVMEVENNDGLSDKFWTDLLREQMSDEGQAENAKLEPRLNPKPVCEPGKKNEKVNFSSKKRKGMQKPIETGSKKRRTDTGEGDFWQVVDEKVTESSETAWKRPSKMYDEFGNKVNVMEILTDAIKQGDGDTLLKKYVDDPPEENLQSLVEKTNVDQIQSYKFKFEDDDEDIKPEKLESEIEVDGLFDEMNMCLQLSEIGSSKTSGVKCGDADFLVDGRYQARCCRHGKHQLTINDEFGIICRYCSYVEMEIRDILPPLCKNGRGGHGRQDHDKTDNPKFSDLKLADCHQERQHDTKESEYEKGTVWDLVPGVKESMYPHQREGFEFIWNKIAGGTYIDKLEKHLPTGGSGCIISHAPGTGKSRLTIVFLQAFLKMYPTSRPLIIAPRSMLLTWEEEFKKWNVDFPFYNMNNVECSGNEHKVAATLLKQAGSIKSPRQIRFLKLYSWKRTPSVLGITYRLFESLAGEERKTKRGVKTVADENVKNFLLQVPTLLVLDEGHTPRNDQSLMWKALLNVKTKRSIILSGTPFQNNFDELYNTLCLVNPLLSFGISSFDNVAFNKKRGWKHSSAKGQWDHITNSVKKGQHRLQELRAMIDPFVHVHKGTILQERLPGLRDALVVLKPTRTQQTLLNRMSGLKPTLENDHIMSLVSVHPALLPKSNGNEGFQKMLKVFENDPRAGVKTHFLMELINLSGAHNEKVLVFSQFLKPLEFIMQLLKTNLGWVEGRECLYMDGGQEEKHRQASINTLNDPKSEVKVLLASLKACSEGINLVGASRVVLLDVHWNPSVERQAISRAYRLGQKKLVHVYHLVTGSMEGEKYIRQVEKSHLSELVFSSKNKDSSNPKISSTVSKDKILEEMVQHEKLQNMFEKVIYQPKDVDLIDTFG